MARPDLLLARVWIGRLGFGIFGRRGRHRASESGLRSTEAHCSERSAGGWYLRRYLPSRIGADSVYEKRTAHATISCSLGVMSCPCKQAIWPRWLARSATATQGPAPMAGFCSLMPIKVEPAAIELWNSDGSRSEISGNGTRCAAALLVESGEAGYDVQIATGAGIKTLRLLDRHGHLYSFEMNMGRPEIEELHANRHPRPRVRDPERGKPAMRCIRRGLRF